MFKPSCNVLRTISGRASFVDHFFVFCVSLPYCFVCFLQPFGHLLGKRWLLDSLVFYVFLCVLFSLSHYSALGHVWYLVVSIPNLCFFPFFAYLNYNLLVNSFRMYVNFTLKNSAWL